MHGLDGDQNMATRWKLHEHGNLEKRDRRERNVWRRNRTVTSLYDRVWEETWCPKRCQFVYIHDAEEDEDEDDVRHEQNWNVRSLLLMTIK